MSSAAAISAAGPSNDISSAAISSPAESPSEAGQANDVFSTAKSSTAVTSSQAGPSQAKPSTAMSSSTFPARLLSLLDEEPAILKIVKDVNMFPDEYDETIFIPTTPAVPPAEPAAALNTSHSESPKAILSVSEDDIQDRTDIDMFSDDGPSVVPVPSLTEEDISMEGT